MTQLATLDAYGALTEHATLTIQRLLPGPIERIWAYLTNSDLRRQWLAAGEMEMKVGIFYANEADFRPWFKVNRPQISVSGAGVSPASPNSYQLTGTATVTVTAPGADTIFYTTDGSHPYEGNAAAQPYTAPVQIVGPGLFRARAFARGSAGSDTAAANFFQI